MKEKLLERFLRYVAVTSQSNAKAGVVPSTEGQRRLAELLAEELRELGLEKIEISESSRRICPRTSPKAARPPSWAGSLTSTRSTSRSRPTSIRR
jgi:acetylornithine deacetylase/succinyl-diaminopimelate desuccinylase-like protein